MDQRLLSRIYNCVKNGQVDSLRAHLQTHSPVNIRFDFGRTILHVAAFFNKPRIIEMMLDEYRIIDNLRDGQRKTAFIVAASKGHMRCLRLLQTRGNINFADERGMTPLLISYKNDHYEIANYLLRSGADYRYIARDGFRVPNEYVYRIMPHLRPQPSPITRRRSIRRESSSRQAVDDVFARQARIQMDMTMAREILTAYSFGLSVPEPPVTAAVPLEPSAEMPVHFKNEFIEMAIALKKTCSICLEPFEKDKTVFTKCSHLLCSGCFQDPRLTKCPLCRIDIK